ncbi:MAG: CoA transferase [Caulobacterales bacterium]
MSAIPEALLEIAAAFGARDGLHPRAALGSIDPFDRSDVLPLARPGRASCSGATHILRTSDGWIAATLARPADWESVAAWLGDAALLDVAPDRQGWRRISEATEQRPTRGLIAAATELGLAVAALGETRATHPMPQVRRIGPRAQTPRRHLQVVDLSSLWAGPLCGAMLAAQGHEVIKLDPPERPDPTTALPALDARLNGAKRRLASAFDLRPGSATHELIASADVVISNARPRVFSDSVLAPERLAQRRPGLVWIAITAHGWRGRGAGRVGFGDDCAAAGGLVGRGREGAPRFLGDALADPLTGMMAAVAATRAIEAGGGVLVDAALARVAAGFAARLGLIAGRQP